MPKEMKQAELTAETTAKLQQWQQLDIQLEAVNKQEFALRQELALTLAEPTKFEGVQSLALGAGWVLKVTKTQNYKLTNEFQETEKLLAAIATALERPDLAQSLVKWSPEMSKSTYKELVKLLESMPVGSGHPERDIVRSLLATALTIKPGAPTLEIIAPEPEKAPAEEASA